MSTNEGFFAVDRRSWARACALGLNPAVAYLVLACGSGGDNRTTKWSDQAIRKYTGLSRGRTDHAMTQLKVSGLVREDMGGTRPRYYLVPAHEVSGCEGHLPSLNEFEVRLLSLLQTDLAGTVLSARSSREWDNQSPYQIALDLQAKKRGRMLRGGRFELIEHNAEEIAAPDWIWLPNSIVMSAAGETSPVQLLRQTQDATALRLFVDLYYAQDLAENGGIHWRRIRQEYTRHEVGKRGHIKVWGFQAQNSQAWGDNAFVSAHFTGKKESTERPDGTTVERDTGWDVFWRAWNLLIDLGLVELIGHVVEADNDNAEIVHPYAIGNGEEDERELARTAQIAAKALLTEGQAEWAENYQLHLLPVIASRLPDVQLVGIARLRYRPRTRLTAAWAARKQEWNEWRTRYQELAEQMTADAPDLQHQGSIKGASK